jgi:hypothetical protein
LPRKAEDVERGFAMKRQGATGVGSPRPVISSQP